METPMFALVVLVCLAFILPYAAFKWLVESGESATMAAEIAKHNGWSKKTEKKFARALMRGDQEAMERIAEMELEEEQEE